MTPSLPCTRSPHGTREGRAPTLAAAKACLCSLALAGSVVLSTGAPLQAQTTFGPQQVISTAGQTPNDVLAVDLGGSEHPDVLVSNFNSHSVGYYLNQDAGNFGPFQAIWSNDLWPHELDAADLDGDGDLDVLSGWGGKIAWHEKYSAIFGPAQVITTEVDVVGDVLAADLDGDGDLDVLSASINDNKIAWYENLGGGSFGPQQVITTSASGARSVHAADLDGDGDADVLSASQYDDKVAWYENLGGGSFGPQQVITTSADAPHVVLATDLDGDGDADVLSASVLDDKIAWCENLGGGSFGPQQVISTSIDGAYALYATDLDQDGDNDVVSAGNYGDVIAWHENLGGGSFGPEQVISTEVQSPSALYAADMDGDGDIDVLSASWGDDKVAWYENLLPLPAPQQLIATTCWGTDAGSPPTTGQSFTADASGNVTAIAMHLQYDQASAGSLILSLYEGSGFAGAELHTQLVRPPYDVGTITPIVDVVLATAVPVVSGQVYTIGVMTTDSPEGGGGFCGTEADVYSGGSYIYAGNPMTARDAAFKVTISPDEPSAWSNAGYALAGLAGDPVLVGSGTLVGGSSNAIVLSHAAPSAPAALFQSVVGSPIPFKGGTLKAFPFFDPPVLSTGPDGTLVLPFVMPPGVPSGVEIWDQWAIKDLAAPKGVSLSNAIRGLFP